MELLKPQNSEYERFEELLLKRDEILKEAAMNQIRYIRECGTLMLESFRVKSECLKFKKKLAYCQMMINHNCRRNRGRKRTVTPTFWHSCL